MINKNEHILITGGGGFIGSHLVEFLLKKGYLYIYSLDRNITNKNNIEGCTYIRGHLSNFDELLELFKLYKFNYVFHLAGNSDVGFSDKFPFLDFESNAFCTLNLFKVADIVGVKKIIFTSSAAVYGQPEFVPVTENHPLNPVSNYAVSKLYGEKLAIMFNKSYNVRSTVVRIFSTYGPRQPRYILFDLLRKLNKNPFQINMLGTPDTVRDYIYVEDTVRAFYEIMISEGTNGEVFNLSGGNPIKIIDFISLVCEIMGINPDINFSNESWKGDIKIFNADISKLKSVTGFVPTVSLREGIINTVNYFKEFNFNSI